MKYYEDFMKLGCFSFGEAQKIVGAETATWEILRKYTNKMYIAKVRRGLYVAINIADGEPTVNKYQIATKISETSVISHHSAFEYYGYSNQVSYNVTVTSESRFNDFSFGGFNYKRKQPSIKIGVSLNNDIRVTDIERTVLDAINDFEYDMGFEELISCISAIPILNTDKLLKYLAEYNKCFLYQKTGYILEHFKDELYIPDTFLETCKKHSGNSSRYLLKSISKNNIDFNNYWHLTVPKKLWQNLTNGGDMDADV